MKFWHMIVLMSGRRAKSEDLNKSVAIANYETESEMKSTFPISFWDLNSNTK